MADQYFTLVIGPVYKTITMARKTRELWAASYLFSFFMKLIIRKVLEGKKFSEKDIIVPYAQDSRIFENLDGVGLFPDQLLVKNSMGEGGEKVFDDAVIAAKKELIAYFIGQRGIRGTPKNKKIFLENYFILNKESFYCDDNPILMMGKVLDRLELKSRLVTVEPFYNPIAELLHIAPSSFLRVGAKKVVFQTLIEYATRELASLEGYERIVDDNLRSQQNLGEAPNQNITPDSYGEEVDILAEYDEEEVMDGDGEIRQIEFEKLVKEEDDLVKALHKHFEKKFKVYHKYVAIINSDGDFIGEALKSWQGDVGELSKILFEWGIETANMIKNYGGQAIYVGGDDVLFFAPVVNGTKHIFNLLADIEYDFRSRFQGGSKVVPTLSFGISFTYYKFPLYEALELSKNLLKKAKEEKSIELPPQFDQEAYSQSILSAIQENKIRKSDNNGFRNAIAWRVLYHSGQYFEARIQKDTPKYEAFKNLLNHPSLKDEDFLTSLVQLFRGNIAIWKNLHQEIEKRGEEPVNSFFRNYFDEYIHEEKKEFIQEVAKFTKLSFEDDNASVVLNLEEDNLGLVSLDKDNSADRTMYVISSIFAVMRTILFIKGIEINHE